MVRFYRDLPDDADVKHVTRKQEATGTWYACFSVEHAEAEQPDMDDIDPGECVGIDLGVYTFVHDSDGRSIGGLDLSADRERLEREDRALFHKEYESNNWHDQRQHVAEVHADMRTQKAGCKY